MTKHTMDSLLRRPEVEQLTGLARSTIYANVQSGLFPAPIKIGKRAVAWRSSDVQAWLESRPVTRTVNDSR